jgi:hypothetical protein
MSERAVSDVVGFILVFALIVSAVAIISVEGLGTLQSVRDAEQFENAERGMSVVRDNTKDIYLSGAPSRATELSLGNEQLYLDDNITLTVTLRDSGTIEKEESWEIRPLVFEASGDRRLVYEAGATFRLRQSDGFRIADPPFIFRQDGSDERVMIPIIGLHSPDRQSVGSSTVLLRSKETNETVVRSDTSGSFDEVELTVDSPRHEHWRAYFEEKGLSGCSNPSATEIQCSYAPGGQLERVVLVFHELTTELDQ